MLRCMKSETANAGGVLTSESARIAGLKESVNSLFNNMPALTFSKDVETGVYLACNQAFAEYAHKDNPDGVVGLTDHEIFAPEIADSFVADDRKALTMDQPHVFFEDVADAAGNPRQFQTTKMKFYDTNGRLCLLGMSEDVTEKERIRKEHEREKAANRKAEESRRMYLRFSALNNNLIVLYFVDPETDRYTEFRSIREYDQLGISKEGEDFFGVTHQNGILTVHPEDQEMFLTQVTKENILRSIEKDGVFVLDYRLMRGTLPTYVRLKAAAIDENGKQLLVIGILDEDAQIRHEMEFAKDLSDARRMASVDALTGVKNKHAYAQWENRIDAQIAQKDQEPFAVVVCDINNMKIVNDLYGHAEGDECIKQACRRICTIFDHSPVFRVGGDEFVVLLTGQDYEQRARLMGLINEIPGDYSQIRMGDIVSAGMAEYRSDEHYSLAAVFSEADALMYERKQFLKRSWLPAEHTSEGGADDRTEQGDPAGEMEKYEMDLAEREIYARMRAPFAVYQFVNRRVVTIALSEGFCDLFGYEDRGMAYLDMDHDMYRDTHPDDVARIADEAFRFASEGGKYEVVYRTRDRKKGGYKVIHALGEHVYTRDGVRLAHVWYTDEGTYTEEPGEGESRLNRTFNNELHMQSLVKASSYDYLTGLPSMTYFFELADAAKAALKKTGESPVFLFFDLNGMKYYNRKHGFAEGDKLIKSFARLLIRTFSHEGCCHIGGDHFAAVIRETGVEDVLNRLFEKWHGEYDGEELSVRVGIYSNGMEEVPVSTACDRAKFACDSIRNNFSSVFSYYNKDLRDDMENRRYILTSLDRAIEREWIQVYYQPIVRAVSGKICDEEALARWEDPERGLLSPAEFIPYLEDAGQMYKLDLYVLDQVLKKIQFMKENGIDVVPQSINLSRSDFDACDIVEEIRRRVDGAGVSHHLITIEITESVIGGEVEFMKGQVERFQKLGFAVWMDDFGSGYSSIDVLQSIRFDLIKFDMSFMKRLNEGKAGKIILTELMRMADALGLDTVCEGVETAEQVQFLQKIGCSRLQGFYFTKPSPFSQVLKKRETDPRPGFENPEEAAHCDGMNRDARIDAAAGVPLAGENSI